jgi:hypothetical protein
LGIRPAVKSATVRPILILPFKFEDDEEGCGIEDEEECGIEEEDDDDDDDEDEEGGGYSEMDVKGVIFPVRMRRSRSVSVGSVG